MSGFKQRHVKRQEKAHAEETEKTSGQDSDMTQMLELSDWEFIKIETNTRSVGQFLKMQHVHN